MNKNQTEQVVREIHRYARVNFSRRKYSMRGIADTLQGDLIEMQLYKKENRGYRYILIVIDIFSKMAYAEPLKNKTANEVTKAMKHILNKVGRPIKNLHTDEGKEFMNSIMKNLLRQYGINHYTTFSGTKASIVERLIRTIKRKIYMLFNINGNWKWYNILQEVIDSYNHTR